MIHFALVLSLSLPAADPGAALLPAWRFVAAPAGDPFEHPPWRAVGLGSAKPDDLVERATYRGRQQRYAQLRYGSPGSTRATVVVDQAGPGDVDLYVDADRNRRIETRDRLEGRG